MVTPVERPVADGAGPDGTGGARRELSRTGGNPLAAGLACRRIEVLFRLDHQHPAHPWRPVTANPLDLRAKPQKQASAAGGMNRTVFASTGVNP